MDSTLRIAIAMAVAAHALPHTVVQAKWQEIGKTSIGNTVYVDPKSVKKSADGIVTATVRVTFVKPANTPKGPITASRTVAMFDCGRKLVAVKENTYYHDEKAGKVYQHSAAAMPGFGPAIKGTLPDIAMAYLCSHA